MTCSETLIAILIGIIAGGGFLFAFGVLLYSAFRSDQFAEKNKQPKTK